MFVFTYFKWIWYYLQVMASSLSGRLIYWSGEALYGEYSYIEEEAVYINIIQGKTIQWESRSIAIIHINVHAGSFLLSEMNLRC